MIILGLAGIISAFVLWCCIKVGKESDRELEGLWEEEGPDRDRDNLCRKDDK
ncbi:MAG: hypothetical protein Q4D16_14415 [Eubacteriales bacterium]|nr:hypothetical protein [Eubacteriales bacterium]